MAARSTATAAALAFGLCLVLVAVLCWPLVAHPLVAHLFTPFGDSHAWVLEQLGLGAVSGPSCAAGFPEARELRLIGWVPLLVGLPLRAVLGSLGAFNLLLLASLPLSAAAAAWLVRRWTGAEPVICALLGLAYAASPTLLGTLAGGELPKLQAWLLPLGLLAMEAALRDRRWLPALALVGLGAAFTSPYYALALPLLAGGLSLSWVLGYLPGPQAPLPSHPHRALSSVLLLGVLATALAPALSYYEADRAGGGEAIFQPARRQGIEAGALPHPAPVAEPFTLLVGPRRYPGSVYEPAHVPTLGLGLVLGGLLGLRRRRAPSGALLAAPSPWPGALLATGGIALALGPVLALGNAYIALGQGLLLPLPVYLLEALNYPTRTGGLYYRYAVLAVLGLCLLTARASAWLPRPRLLVGLLVALQLGHSVLLTGGTQAPPLESHESPMFLEPPFMWPRPGEVVAEADVLASLHGSDGAVLELPLQGPTDGQLGQAGLLRALFHGRPVSSLPRDRKGGADPARGALQASVAAKDPDQLRDLGFRYVLLDAALDWYASPDRAALTRAFGEPSYDGELVIWDLGATGQDCMPGRDTPGSQ